MLKLALLGALALAPVTVRAQFAGNYARVLTTTPQLVIAQGAVAGWGQYYRVCNVDTTNTAWLSRYSASPLPNTAGSYPLAPSKCEEFSAGGGFVPLNNATYGVAQTGTVQLTVEVH